MDLHLGKQDPVYDRRTLLLEHFTTATLVAPAAVPPPSLPWGMLGNDTAGDCVWAGADHEVMLWHAASSRPRAVFTSADALADYSAVTGYTPSDPATDKGTMVLDAMKYRTATGVRDHHGARHKLGAYAALTPGHQDHIRYAIATLSAVGVGIQFPSSAMDQFQAGKPWSVVAGARIEGGHYIPLCGYDARYAYCVTWGKVQPMTWGFLTRYCDEAWGLLSPELLTTAGRSPHGLDLNGLRAALTAATG